MSSRGDFLSIKVAILDDHPVLLAGMGELLAGAQGMTIAGLVRDSTELVRLLGSQLVDVVLTDFSMPHGRFGDGIALLRFLQRRFPQIKLALFTGVESPSLLQSVIDIRVSVIVSKVDSLACLEPAIRAAYANDTYLSPRVVKLLAQSAGRQVTEAAPTLSKRESEVLRMFAEGMSLKEIGVRVGRSPKTISAQKSSAMKKLDLTSDAEIFKYAIVHGLVPASQASLKDALDSGADV
ncbi:response regulator transcription factor [Dyella japonica]|uniref:Two-component system capsular synthesis response regulator RcsB n=1 Tax=Dyella japonica TaxID=231455 RepID=A0ABV2K118_9GAMM